MSDAEIKRMVEAVLFAADTPIDIGKISDVLGGASRSDIRAAVAELNDDYDREGHSFRIAEIAGGWQLYCRPDYMKWVRELHKGRMTTRLSQAALETLAIVAYKQPIVRAEIEIIRGVDSSGVLATLLKRNLVTIAGRAPGMGRALMYGTTREFLRYFGLNAVTDLPRLEEFAEVLGLQPDELELAVEGAEALAGADDDTDEAADSARVGASSNGSASMAASESATPGTAGGLPESETRDGSERQNGQASDSEATVTHDGEEIIRKVRVKERKPGSDRHTLRDQDLVDSLDED